MNKRELEYLEIHIVNHCNLNCKGCSHFCPLTSSSYLDTTEFKNDLSQLKNYIDNIKQLRLMGGEPLLHPQWIKFFEISRKLFPQSRIAMVTNGVLIPRINHNSFKLLKKLNIEIHISEYPIIKNSIGDIIKLLKNYQISHEIKKVVEFYKHIVLSQNRAPIESFNICRENFYCPSLKEGKLFQCGGLANFKVLKEYFNLTDIPNAIGLDIYDKNTTFEIINNFLNQPDYICKYCNYRTEAFRWDYSIREFDEWIAEKRDSK